MAKSKRFRQIQARKRDAESKGGKFILPKKADTAHPTQDRKAAYRLKREAQARRRLHNAHISDNEIERIRREIAQEAEPG